MAWDYPMFFMFKNAVGYCCRTPRIDIDNELLEEMKEDFWSNHPSFVNRRKELINGIKSKDCDTCWQLEDAGFKSSRNDDHFNMFMKKNYPNFNEKLDQRLFKFFPGIERSNYSNVIEIVLNNTCDAKCTYCSEHYSTQWVTEKKKFGGISPYYTDMNDRNPRAEELFWSWYENKVLHTNKRFGFIGGEPLIIDALYECFDKLIEIHERKQLSIQSDADKMELCITSNMNTPPAYFEKFMGYVKKLEKHFRIIIQVSGENVGDDLEYIRHGVKWKRWSRNVEYLLDNTNITLNFLPCLSLLTIPRFNEYIQYVNKLNKKYGVMKIHQNIVTWPVEQSPMIAPKEFSQYFDPCIDSVNEILAGEIKDRFIRGEYENLLLWLTKTREAIISNPSASEPVENAKKFYSFFNELDRRRNTSVLKIFPEIKEFYDTGKQLYEGTVQPRIIPIVAVTNE